TELSAIGINTKTVTIPAATAAATEWTVSVPIDVWDDDVVEQTLVADNENFFLQIDGYRDKGADASWATGDDNTESVTSDNTFEVTIKDNDLPPAAFTVGSVITKATNTDPIVAGHWNPITAGYWNSYNTGLTVTVPIENSANLIGGTVRLMAKKDGFSYTYLSTPTKTITQDEIDAGTYAFEVTTAEFEGSDSPTEWYTDGNLVLISAAITDNDGNITYGTESETRITIDESLPVIANYVISSAVATGGTVVANYWNSTNTGLDVSVKVLGADESVNNGSVRVLAGIGTEAASAAYYQLGDLVDVDPSDNIADGIVLSSITAAQVEAQTEYAESKTINLKAEVVDIAGNKAEIAVASDKPYIDTVLPLISRVESINPDDGSANNGLFGIDNVINIKFTFSETLTLTDGVATVGLDVITAPEIVNADLQDVGNITISYTVAEDDESANLTFTGLTLPTGKLRDNAGNDMAVFTADTDFSLEDISTVEVDGIYPDAFQVDTVHVLGSDSVYASYWNSNTTSLVVALKSPGDNDISLNGGSVQLRGRVYDADTDTALSWQDIGSATILVESIAEGGGTEPSGTWNSDVNEGVPYHYGEFAGNPNPLHFQLDESTVEAMTDFPDKSLPLPEYNMKVDFAAIITDKAGNSTYGTATTGSLLIVDEVMPLDPAMGLPESGYNYSLAAAFDNYEQILPDTVIGSGYSREGYFNSTNTGLTFKSWISFDDDRGDFTIDRDPSLAGGTVQVEMSSSSDVATATWHEIGTAQAIQQADVDAGFVNVSVDSAAIRAVTDVFIEGNTLYYRNIVTDIAGNITEQSVASAKTISIDTTPHDYLNLTYSRKYVNGSHSPTITATFDPSDRPYSAPKFSAVYTIDSGSDPTDVTMTPLSFSNYTFYIYLDVPGSSGESQYDGAATISISATDIAGNPLVQDSITQRDYLVIDNTPPEVGFVYTNTTNAAAALRDSGRVEDIIRVVAIPNEPMYLSLDTDNEVSKPTLTVKTVGNQITV
ncbi:MAG: hypothetical protein NZ807_08030, partial [Dehalococcoidia bacterium]|nr:hypothetical protein [Dehalococcoidia bacterium]